VVAAAWSVARMQSPQARALLGKMLKSDSPSLRALGEFLVNQNLAASNPAVRLSIQHIDPTIGQILNEFKNELRRQKLSPSTIKNYYSDVKQYLLWAKDNIKNTDNKLDLLS
jgi:site-specific recombinase XerD